VLGCLGMIDLVSPMAGGYVGKLFGAVERLFGIYAGFIILFSVFASGLIMASDAQFNLNILVKLFN